MEVNRNAKRLCYMIAPEINYGAIIAAALVGWFVKDVWGRRYKNMADKADKYETAVTTRLSDNQKEISRSLEKCWERVDDHEHRLTKIQTQHEMNHPPHNGGVN